MRGRDDSTKALEICTHEFLLKKTLWSNGNLINFGNERRYPFGHLNLLRMNLFGYWEDLDFDMS